jgi:hypothetical protein
MYLVRVDQTTREEIQSAAAAHGELGRGYDQAVAEGLVERIGAEIDKRVDARLGHRGQQAQMPAPAERPAWVPVAIAGASIGGGVGVTALVLFARATNVAGRIHNTISGSQLLLVALIWVVVAVVNVAYARRR